MYICSFVPLDRPFKRQDCQVKLDARGQTPLTIIIASAAKHQSWLYEIRFQN